MLGTVLRPYLLATHPQADPVILTTIATTSHASEATAAALTHPAMPTDVPIVRTAALDSRGAQQVLECPRTTAARRAQVLERLRRGPRLMLLRGYADLSGTEIADLAGDMAGQTALAFAVARHPATEPDVVCLALLEAAASRSQELLPLSIALLAHERGADAALMDQLADMTASRVTLEGPEPRTYFAPGQSVSSLIDLALAHVSGAQSTIVRQTRSTQLMTRGLKAGGVSARFVRRHLPPGPPDSELLALLDQVDPPETADAKTLLALSIAAHEGTLDLERALTAADLTSSMLRTVVETLAGEPHASRRAGHREDPRTALLQVAAHPACPPDLLPAIASRTADAVDFADDDADWHGPRLTHTIARARLAGAAHPGRAVELPTLRRYGGTDEVVNAQIRTSVEAHPTWPPTPEQAQVLLALYDKFPGTLGELLDTAHAVTS